MSQFPESIDFSDEELYKEIPFTVPGENTGFFLHTASGKAATDYQNRQSRAIKFDAKGNAVGMNDIASLEPFLISITVRAEDGSKVDTKRVGKWPYPIQKKLFKMSQELSGLGAEARNSSLIYKAFEEHDPPCSLQELRQWTERLPEKEFKSIQMLFSECDEEKAKNS